MTKATQFLLQLEKLLSLQDSIPKQFGKWLTSRLFFATEHLPDKEESIFKIFKKCVVILFMIRKSKCFKKKILSTLEYPLKNKWAIFLDKLSSLEDQNTLAMYLFKTFVQESISREKDFRPFWTPAYETISESLLLPIETGFVGLASSSLNHWSPKQEEKSQFLTVQTRKLMSKNLQKTSCQSSMSSLVDKWENEVIQEEKKKTKTLKTIQIKLFPTKRQKELIDEFINTSRFVSNKAIECIEKGHKPSFKELRDMLVTSSTKKHSETYTTLSEEIMNLHYLKHKTEDSKDRQRIVEEIKSKNKTLLERMKEVDYEENQNLKEFEKNTPKEIRANAVQSVCDAYKSGFTNLKNGNIKYFKMKFKKKSTPKQTIELAPSSISLSNGVLKILPRTFKDECILKISNKNKKKHKDLTIENNVDIVRKNGTYFAHILKAVEHKDKTVKEDYNMCGVDPGVRTFATSYSYSTKDNKTIIREYEHRVDLLTKLNNKMEKMKERKKRIKKKHYNKIEKKKKYIVDSLHWDTINHLLLNNDLVFYGDIKSQAITKGNKNKTLNQDFNDLKFYIFKTRLKYKAETLAKQAIILNESFTTKTCSGCGTINNNVGSSKIFSCSTCNLRTGRDENASKNILMKGLFS